MASKAFLIAVAIVATIVAPTMAKEIVVGGEAGWRLGINYQAWADEIEFHVGDTLVFNYVAGNHNVLKVNGPEFQFCAKPLDVIPLTSGHDVITLATPGRKWYICGVGSHCQTGPMKFAITVQPGLGSATSAPAPAPSITVQPGLGSLSPAPAPSPAYPYSSANSGIAPSEYF